METKQKASEILGPPPWTDEQLTRAYFADFVGIFRALHKHPGYRLHAELENLTLSMKLFGFAVHSLNEAVEAFRRHSNQAGFRTRAEATTMEEATLAVQAGFFQATTTASAFKARAHTLGGRISVPGFQQEFDATFTQNDRHHFVQDMRDHLSHVAPLSAEWELSRAGRQAEQVARFLLFVDDLNDAAAQGRRGWGTPARRFIENHRRGTHPHGGEIDVVSLFENYLSELQKFYGWLLRAAETATGTPLTDYRAVERRFYQIATRIGWKALLIPWLKQKADPRAMLNARLIPDEIAVVDALPTGSKEQVDQLIKFVDDAEYGFVDTEIRDAIYRAFGL